MPTFTYKCEDCSTKYEVFHKVKENDKEIICPSCESKNAKKIMSAPNIGVAETSYSTTSTPTCPSGECMCGMN